jgi:hypothetical protein
MGLELIVSKEDGGIFTSTLDHIWSAPMEDVGATESCKNETEKDADRTEIG